jgi:hypothetical protein
MAGMLPTNFDESLLLLQKQQSVIDKLKLQVEQLEEKLN